MDASPVLDEPIRPRPAWHVPRLRSDDRLVAGVASGIAEEIGVAPLMIRASFIVLATAGWGFVLYAVLWAAMAADQYARAGAVDVRREPKGSNATTRAMGVGFVVVGLLLFFRTIDLGFSDAIVWPVSLLALGVVVAWNRGVLERDDESQRTVVARIAVGLGLALAGLIVLVSTNLDRGATLTAVGAIVVVCFGLAVVLGPWVWRTLEALGEERRRRIRSEERADVAAHLHDSVLQTLALIQRQSDDPQAMVSLARRQERDLRDWLFADVDEPSPGAVSFRAAIAEAAAGVEELHHVPIEVVTVGDVDMVTDDRLVALVAAAKEAMTNASRHSAAATIDVYAEVTPERVEVFVRDTGQGFDPQVVGDDRRGLADSVLGRMQRAGGSAIIDSTVGEGTEVALSLDREVPS